MAKELVIGLYLLIFKMQFNFFKLFPQKNKVTFVVSFDQNPIYVYKELEKRNIEAEVVFLCKKACSSDILSLNRKTYLFETINIIDMIKGIYHLATSRYILIDNYYGFLSAVTFKENVQCIQLWHAAGAIKTFGLRDLSISNRSETAMKRFLTVYQKFNKIVVGSDVFANIFMEAFKLPAENILRTGVPRTDIFFDEEHQQKIRKKLFDQTPQLKDKKIILYAPTYRDEELIDFDLKLDLDLLYKEFHNDFVVIVKLHPAIKNRQDYEQIYFDFVFDYSSYKDINELLIITDYLITDYSSIPFEYALLKRPMLFFAYDLEKYQHSRGLWVEYEQSIPGPIAFTTEKIVSLIKSDEFNIKQIEEFANMWNKYSDGHSSQKLVDYLFKEQAERDMKPMQNEE